MLIEHLSNKMICLVRNSIRRQNYPLRKIVETFGTSQESKCCLHTSHSFISIFIWNIRIIQSYLNMDSHCSLRNPAWLWMRQLKLGLNQHYFLLFFYSLDPYPALLSEERSTWHELIGIFASRISFLLYSVSCWTNLCLKCSAHFY